MLDDILKPKSEEIIIKDIFKDTSLENALPNDIYYFNVHSRIGTLGKNILIKYNINFKEITNNNYILSAPFITIINYFIKIGWTPYEIKEYLINKSLYK
jgi:hypothetical protein